MLAVAAAITTSNSSSNQNLKNLAQTYYSNVSALKRNSQSLTINTSAKRLKSGSSSPFNSINMSYKVEELLKNQNCLSSIDNFASSVSPTLLANVKVNDVIHSTSATGLRFLDNVMNKAFAEKNILSQNESNNIQSENLIIPTTKFNNNSSFGNTFNSNATLVTSIALAQKALECRNGLAVAAAAATLAGTSNNTFNNNTSFLTNNNLSTLPLFNSFTPTKYNNNNNKNNNKNNKNNAQLNVLSTNEFTSLNNEKVTNLEEYLPRSKSPDYQNLVRFIFKKLIYKII